MEKAIKDAGYTTIKCVAYTDKCAATSVIAKLVQPVKRQSVILTAGDKISNLLSSVTKMNQTTNYPILYTIKYLLNDFTKKSITGFETKQDLSGRK